MLSPTYTIVNEYRSGRLPLFHFDLYRIGSEDELFEIGWEDYLAQGGVCAVEWSENVPELLNGALHIAISRGPDSEDERIYHLGRRRTLCRSWHLNLPPRRPRWRCCAMGPWWQSPISTAGLTHSRTLTQLGQNLLETCEQTVQDLDAVACAAGGQLYRRPDRRCSGKGLAWAQSCLLWRLHAGGHGAHQWPRPKRSSAR